MNKRILLWFSLLFFISSCSKPEVEVPQTQKSSAKQLLSFGFTVAENQGLTADVSGVISGDKVTVSLPSGCDLKSLAASFSCSPKATVKVGDVVQTSKISKNDFSGSVVYTVQAEDGSTSAYTVTVTRLQSSAKQLTGFKFEKSKNSSLEYDLVCGINEDTKRITLLFPATVVVRQLAASFTVSEKASVKINTQNLESGVTTYSYASGISIIVTAEDGSNVTYIFDSTEEQAPAINMTLLTDKVKALNYFRRGPNPSYFTIPDIVPVLSTAFAASKPAGSFAFDCGYVGEDRKIYISQPLSPEQKALFPDANSAALFYLSKAFISHYFNYSQMPLWFNNGFACYESGLRPDDSLIGAAINLYGGRIPEMSEINSSDNFRNKGGIYISYLFGEFMSVYFCWPYFDILGVSASEITVAPWRFTDFNTLYAKWLRYVEYRIIKSGNQRLKWQQETGHFKPMYRDADASLNFPYFTDQLESAFNQYKGIFALSYPVKLTFLTMPESIFAYIDGITPDGRITGGTAWPSGLSSTCALQSDHVSLFKNHLRHELAHEFQSLLMKPGVSMPAWLNEGFPSFMADGGKMSDAVRQQLKGDAVKALSDATAYFSHRPLYLDIAVYPNPYFNYYLLGQIMYEFIFDKGGYAAVKAVTENPVAGFATIGYSTPEAFMNAYYDYFEKNWR